MEIKDYREMAAQKMDDPALSGVSMRVVIGPDDGAPNFVMRVFEVKPGGYTPKHTHDWEHEVFILSGDCIAVSGDGETRVGPGNAVFIPPNEIHQFRNAGDGPLEFICLIPSGVG